MPPSPLARGEPRTGALARVLEPAPPAPASARAWTPMVLNLLGLALLAGLASRLPLAAVVESIRHMGARVLAVFAFGLVWIACDILALASLARRRLPWATLLHTELVAEAMARLIPAGGLGGEPYRTRRLAALVGYGEAGRVVMRYRLVHALCGLSFAAAMLGLAPWLVAIPPAWARSFAGCACAFGLLSAVLTWVSLSPWPARVAGWLLDRLRLAPVLPDAPEAFLAAPFWKAVAAKLTAFVLQLAELWVIFRLLGVNPTLAHLVVVAATLAGTATIMFFVPQGLGVSELGITLAFGWLGLPAWMGLSFGLVRRGRLVFWTLVGVLLYAAQQGLRRSPHLEVLPVAPSEGGAT